jgi:hypothetical protein
MGRKNIDQSEGHPFISQNWDSLILLGMLNTLNLDILTFQDEHRGNNERFLEFRVILADHTTWLGECPLPLFKTLHYYTPCSIWGALRPDFGWLVRRIAPGRSADPKPHPWFLALANNPDQALKFELR